MSTIINIKHHLNKNKIVVYVTTLALGSWLRQRHGKLHAKNAVQLESHIYIPESAREYVREWAHTLLSGFLFWELESLWNSNFKEQF
jgi:hypothetical protein